MAKCIKLYDLIPLLDWDHDEQAWYINPEELEHLEENAIDAVPVVHAKWNLKHIGVGHYWECSACHINPCIYVTENTKYCPNCGARMDGEREEDTNEHQTD